MAAAATESYGPFSGYEAEVRRAGPRGRWRREETPGRPPGVLGGCERDAEYRYPQLS